MRFGGKDDEGEGEDEGDDVVMVKEKVWARPGAEVGAEARHQCQACRVPTSPR
jgi:hypothetical protein